jgi:hypothetical protein
MLDHALERTPEIERRVAPIESCSRLEDELRLRDGQTLGVRAEHGSKERRTASRTSPDEYGIHDRSALGKITLIATRRRSDERSK